MDIYSYVREISKGTRFPGSDGSKVARDYLVDFLDKCGVEYGYSYSKMPNWSINGYPQIEISKPEHCQLIAFPAMFSLPTNGYVEGQLVSAGTIKMLDTFDWDKYTVINNGVETAHIISSDKGAQMQPLPFDELNLPCVIVDSNSNAKIKALLSTNENITVRLTNPSNIGGLVDTTSIIGNTSHSEKLPLICAHYDTVYNVNGANDNASGVAVLMELIKNSNLEFKFAFFDGEECNKVGSKAFVDELKSNNRLNSISYVIELDSVGVGDEIGLLVSNKSYKPLKRINLDSISLGDHRINPSRQTRIAFSDVWYFMSEGIPVIRMLTRGHNSGQIMHSTSDTIDKIEVEALENTYKITEFIIKNMQI